MATPNSVLPPKSSREQDERYNPSSRGFNDVIDHGGFNGDEQKNISDLEDSFGSSARDIDGAEEAEQKAAGLRKNSSLNEFNYSQTNAGNNTEKPRVNLKKLLNRKSLVGGGVGGGIIAAIFGFSALSPFGAFISIKEWGSDWANKFDNHVHLVRSSVVNKESLFSNPDLCGAVAVRCKLMGTNQKTIDKIREAGKDSGLTIDDNDIATSKSGKKYLKGMTYQDASGNKTRVTAANFSDLYKNNPRFLAPFSKIASPGSIVTRGTQALKKFAKEGVNRSNPLGDATTEDELVKEMRKQQYSDGDPDPGKATAGEDDSSKPTPTQSNGVSDFNSSITEAADKLRTEALANGPGLDDVSITGGLNTTSSAALSQVAKDTAKSATKGALFGAIGKIDSYCSLYQTVRIASFGAKVWKARALIKYAGIFFTTADKTKAGKGTAAEATLIGKILTKPSRDPISKGKTFSNSAIVTLTTQGKIDNRGSVARFTNGTPALAAIDKLKGILSKGGASAATCSKVKAWYGQVGLLTAGLAASIATGGANAIAGATLGVAEGVILSVAGQYLTPWLIQYAAGVVAPDPLTDPEGGYGAGNAIAAGIGAFGSQLGRGNGLRPLTKNEFKSSLAEANASDATLAEADEINDPTPFTDRVGTSLATTLLPLSSAVSSLNFSSVITSSLNLFSSTNLLPKTSAADQVDSYQGDLCEDDDYAQLSLATDAFCNPIYSQSDSDLESSVYDPDAVILYMLNNKYIDNSGAVIDNDVKDFISTCVDGDDPLNPDGYNADLSSSDTKDCMSKDIKFQMIRMYTMDQNIVDANSAGVAGTLGQAQAIDDTTTSPGGGTGDVSSSGFAWPLGAQAWKDHRADFLHQHYNGGGFIGNGTSSDDISWGGIKGTPVYAMLGGTVVKQPMGRSSHQCVGNPNSPNNGGIEIESNLEGHKIVIVYAHGDHVEYSVGQTVDVGKQIMEVGDVGNSCGAHMHMNATVDGKNICVQDLFLAMDAGGTIDLAALEKKTTALCEGRG